MSRSSSFGSIPTVVPKAESEAGAPDAPPWLQKPVLATMLSPFAALTLGGSVLLWAHYGTTVFFETMRAAFTACFG